MTRSLLLPLILAIPALSGAGCSCDGGVKHPDAGSASDAELDSGADVGAASPDAEVDSGAGADAGGLDAEVDAGELADAGGLDAEVDAGASADAGSFDAGEPDASAPEYSCRGFTSPSGWTTADGFRSVEAFVGLKQPIALSFAGGAYGAWLYIVNQQDNTVSRADLATGAVEPFATLQDSVGSHLLTTITWDSRHDFDGALYVGDQGSDGDQDSVIYRLTPEGALVPFARAPAASSMPGLDDIFGLSFTPGSAADWPIGLLVTGDTDGAVTTAEWGLYDSNGAGQPFSALAGTEGLCVDTSGNYGGGMLASRPNGGGYSGDDTIIRLRADGTSGGAIASNIPGVHAVTVAPPGPFGQLLYAASWSSGRLFSVDADGTTRDIATGLSLSNYDGNVLAFSPDGKVLLVADRSRNRVVCVEPAPLPQ